MKNKSILDTITNVFSAGVIPGAEILGLKYEQKNISQRAVSSMTDIHNIIIESISSAVKIEVHEAHDIIINYEGEVEINASAASPTLKVQKEETSLTIKIDYEKHSTNIFKDNTVLSVLLPKEYAENLDVETISGEITINQLTINSLTAASVSAPIHLTHSSIDKMSLQNISGAINCKSHNGAYASISNKTGHITLDIPLSYNIKFKTKTITGETKVAPSSDTTTDTIELDLSNITGNINVTRY